MNKTPVIGIFDIGKTNKKLFLFDEQYRILFEKSETFTETKDEDGDACEDLPLLTHWIKKLLDEISLINDLDLRAVNFSAYGASFVHINREGNPVTPLYNYLKPYPDKLKDQFYEKYGNELIFSMQTASPVLGNLNSGLQLYLLKNIKPDRFKEIRYSLHLPQYLSFLVSNKCYSDITSIGCHTALWDFSKNDYHEWVYRENIRDKLAPIFPSDQLMQAELNKKELLTGAGLHDSSAALIPYLSNFTDPFVLISTGTWCISLNPFNQESLTAEELQQDCLCYLEYNGRPIKASRLFAGYDHEQQVKRLGAFFNAGTDYYKTISYEPETITRLQKNTSLRINKTEIKMEQSEFSKRELSAFADYAEAYHQLIIDIINQQVVSTNLVLKNGKVTTIFLDGGFSRNSIYMHLLAAAYPHMQVYAASVAQASALGAALAVHPYWNKNYTPADLVELKQYKAPDEVFI